MKLPLKPYFIRRTILALAVILTGITGVAQSTETFSTGSFIINMGEPIPIPLPMA